MAKLKDRGNFGTKIGIILATAGSAVGLGNIWRFPYMAGQDGGAAFILIYIACVLLLGIPGMAAEFIVGRHAATNAARAYGTLTRFKAWGLVGAMGMMTSTFILGFYSVIAGWCLQYLYASLIGQLSGDADFVRSYFLEFSTCIWKPALWGVAFVVLTHSVVVRGVSDGIEKASKLMMPTLFVLLLIIVVASCLLPGAWGGVEFLFKPDFTKLSSNVFLDALGQAFFSLSLGTACLCTYASYFKRDTNLVKSAGQIALIDTLVAVLAGLMIFPAAFSVGVEADAGPSLIFITLPNVFNQAFSSMPLVGYGISILFYALLALAALTSTISMHEIGTAFLHEELGWRRRWSGGTVTLAASVICVLCTISGGKGFEGFTLFGMQLLDFFDFLTGQLLLPFGAFLTCILVGWVADERMVRNEFTNGGTVATRLYRAWLLAVRIICPLCIALIFLHQLGII